MCYAMHRIKWLSYYGERAGVLKTNRIACAQFEKGRRELASVTPGVSRETPGDVRVGLRPGSSVNWL